MKTARRRIVTAALAASAALALAACGSTTASTGSGSASSPTVVEFWGWNQGQEAMVAAFNAHHHDIRLDYKRYPGNSDLASALGNAVSAKNGIPCLVQAPATPIAMLAKDLVQPVTEYLSRADAKRFSAPALASVKAGGQAYGIPFGASPTFAIINRSVYDANGLDAPKTWSDVLADGEVLGPKGISVLNFAGEDPTTLVNMANQAGATWFAIDGDAWKVRIDSAATRKAGAVIQKLIDGDMVSHETYADIAAMAQTYDQGKMVSIPLSTWQLASWQQRLSATLGDWEPIDLPQYSATGSFVAPGSFVSYVVPKGCTHPAAATAAAVALATDPRIVTIAASPTTGAGTYPVTSDASDYVQGLLPATLLGTTRDRAPAIIAKASDATRVQWIDGPSTGFFDEMTTWWAKAVNKEVTVDAMIEHLQGYVVKDLKTQGITVED